MCLGWVGQASRPRPFVRACVRWCSSDGGASTPGSRVSPPRDMPPSRPSAPCRKLRHRRRPSSRSHGVTAVRRRPPATETSPSPGPVDDISQLHAPRPSCHGDTDDTTVSTRNRHRRRDRTRDPDPVRAATAASQVTHQQRGCGALWSGKHRSRCDACDRTPRLAGCAMWAHADDAPTLRFRLEHAEARAQNMTNKRRFYSVGTHRGRTGCHVGGAGEHGSVE